jgi:hypothetical protein
MKFNADHYTPDELILLAEWREIQIGRTDRKLIVHAENTRSYPAKMNLDFLVQNRMKKHPSHRTRLALSDFSLFSHVR